MQCAKLEAIPGEHGPAGAAGLAAARTWGHAEDRRSRSAR
jgi:hypothetical protein